MDDKTKIKSLIWGWLLINGWTINIFDELSSQIGLSVGSITEVIGDKLLAWKDKFLSWLKKYNYNKSQNNIFIL